MFELLLNFAYTSHINITRTNVQSLLSAANLLDVAAVRDACCQVMEENMDVCNCIGVHCFSESLSCCQLQEKSKNFILKNFEGVSEHEEFLKLSRLKVIEFVSHEDLCVQSESSVFNAVIRWLEADKPSRSIQFESILRHVRLPLLSPYFLVDVVAKHDVITSSEECKHLLEEAKTFHLLVDRRHEMITSRENCRFLPRRTSDMRDVIISVGGEDDKVVLRSVEMFEVETCQWQPLACLPFAISKHGLVVSGRGEVFMGGGEFPDGTASRSLWKYNPCLDRWAELAAMNTCRSELGECDVTEL